MLRRFHRCAFVIAGFLVGSIIGLRAQPQSTEILPPGYRPLPPGVHALVGAKVVVKPGEVLDKATIVIRDGLIQSVGKSAEPPADARIWDMQGMTIYAGFIDPYLVLNRKSAKPEKPAGDEEPGGSDVTEQLRSGSGINYLGVPAQEREPTDTTGPGYDVVKVTPEHRVANSFSPDTKDLEKLREIGFTAGNVVPDKGIIRGTSAFVALSDTEPNRAIIRPDVFQHIAFNVSGRGRGSAYPGSLMGVIAVVRQTFFDAQHYALDQADYRKHPASRVRPPYNLSLEALAPASEKKMRVVFEPTDALMVDRATRVAKELDLDFCIVSSGQEWRWPDLAKAADVPFIVPLNYPTLPKLPQEDDWEQATLDQLRAWDWAPENAAVLRQQGLEISLTTYKLANKGDFRKNLRLALDRGLDETNALAALTTVPARLCGVGNMLGTIEAGKLANLTVVDGKGYFDSESKVRSVWIDGRIYRIPVPEEKDKDKGDAIATNETSEAGDTKAGQKGETAKDEKSAADKKQADKEKKLAKVKELQKRVARAPLEGRGAITNPPSVLVKNATIWTSGPQGILTNADLLVEHGKIKAVGRNLGERGSPSGVLVIDGTDLQVTPGIIDCHSHSVILGGVNESTLPCTAMVRIGDVVNADAATIYQQLAGGVTAVNLLHGSANPIGGQNCVIKLRDGEPPENLKFAAAPQGIKFALGENVKQSNWGTGNNTRFPQTRMGVRTFYANRFTAAQQYLKEWADYKKSGGVPPRRDLQLEALGEILEGKRLIHCHGYRQDELLMLTRLTQSFGIQIATFQHGLEAYKIADELAAAKIGVSMFADWWAYKVEAFDAIPYNGSLSRERGIVVSFNSDSDDLARRLYLEAAKAVKYGGTPEAEALKFVTLNPAIQLHIDKYAGSLEPGKDADFAIWSKSPLDSGTVCQQTWIDGKKYFDLSLAPARATAITTERANLLAKAKKLAALSGPGGSGGEGGADTSFFEVSLEHQYDGVTRHCLDDENE